MPATHRTATEVSRHAAPYSLPGASRPQLAGMTVTALMSHLKHYKLPITGKKSILVDHLHSHLHSSWAIISVDMLDSDTSNSQQHAQVVNMSCNASSQQSSPLQMGDNSPALPQQLLNQLTVILQQAQSPTTTGVAHATPMQLDTVEDDRLSAASLPVQSNPLPALQAPAPVQVNLPHPSTTTAVLSSLPQPTLPPIPSKIQERIARGSKIKYIDFTSLLSRSIFGAPEYQSQTFTLQLNPSGEKYSIQPTALTASKKITSFTAWLEAWNVYLAVRISLDPFCAVHLVAYQRIINSANSHHPLHVYDIKFRTKAANDPSLRWDIRDLELSLECFPGTSNQPNRWPCHHCGSTTHYPSNCSFHSSSPLTGGKQGIPVNSQQWANIPQTPTCHDFNRTSCYRENCKFSHWCDICARTHPAKNCLTKRQFQPR